MLFQHDAAHFVYFRVWRDGDRVVIHVLAHGAAADLARVFMQRHQYFTERQHADQVAKFHDHQRTDVFFSHGIGRVKQGMIGRDRVENVALDLENFRYFHDGLPVRVSGILVILSPYTDCSLCPSKNPALRAIKSRDSLPKRGGGTSQQSIIFRAPWATLHATSRPTKTAPSCPLRARYRSKTRLPDASAAPRHVRAASRH